jgi:hypothetical protein
MIERHQHIRFGIIGRDRAPRDIVGDRRHSQFFSRTRRFEHLANGNALRKPSFSLMGVI